MNNFVEQLRLAEKAAEDIYFAKVSQELIQLLHTKMQREADAYRPSHQSNAEVRPQDGITD